MRKRFRFHLTKQQVNDINQIIAIFAEATGKDAFTVNQLANDNQWFLKT